HLNLQKLPRIIHLAYRTQQSLGHVHLVENWQLHRHLRELFKTMGWRRRPLPVFQVKVNDEVTMDAVSGKPDQHAQVANRPNDMSDTSLHRSSHGHQSLSQ